ncbi:MAG: DNA repair protein RadA [Crocinitomicaceae bacterium]|nr:DNA repair protein RadA [Crocinitomicaceae bacterium]
MAKAKKRFVCSECGHAHPQWVGQCAQCKAWNTLEEEQVQELSQRGKRTGAVMLQAPRIQPLSEVDVAEMPRLSMGDKELNRVLGGGAVPGGVVLLGGEPGIGKSTLMLQVALEVAATGAKVLYVSGEESAEQVRMRANRLAEIAPSALIFPQTQVPAVLDALREERPSLVVVDSVQTLDLPDQDGVPGSVGQIRESAAALTAFAKTTGTPLFMVGHITKEGSLAGPKVLEHMVDVVLQFEGDRHHAYRMLRAAKNRFGTTAELGIYEMTGEGLSAVDHPSEVLLGERGSAESGSAVAVSIQGARPLLVEIQALVSTAVYGTPQRSGTGFDLRRLNMLLAVLEKRCGFKLGVLDVFLNLAGGLKIQDPANDLAVVAAILSSSLDLPLDNRTCFAGEVGLSGEIRPVPRLEQRMAEAARLGMERMLISGHGSHPTPPKGLTVVPVKRVNEVQRVVF